MIPDTILPTVNASLNFLSACLLWMGFVTIRQGNREVHKKYMLAALMSSAIFLTCYLVYHYQVGSVKYPFQDWTRPLYYVILVPHVLLAALMTPFIFVIVWRAFQNDFDKHKILARRVWPVWMFVSVTGVVIYLMLYGRSYLFS